MKYFLLFFLAGVLFLPFSSFTKAHGDTPFTSINNVPNQTNPAASGSIFFTIPNELAAQNFVVNEKLNFKVDPKLLPDGGDKVVSTDFLWEFANGQTGVGLSASSSYSKPGSYIVLIKVKDSSNPEPVELESMQVNILPDKAYQAPQAVITVNGKKVEKPFEEPISIKSNSPIKFSAKSSKGLIKKYTWDFADGTKLQTGSEVEHTFASSSTFFPILRVEDENGIYSNSIVQLSATDTVVKTNNNQSSNSATVKSNFLPIFVTILAGVLLIASFFVISTRKKSS